MRRYNRSRFFAFGLLQAFNALAMLLYGLGLATHGRGGSERSLPLLIGLVAACLLALGLAAVKRGRDLGWPAALTVLVLLVGAGLGPFTLVLLGYFTLARGAVADNAYGPPGAPMNALAGFWAVIALVVPWIMLGIAARLF